MATSPASMAASKKVIQFGKSSLEHLLRHNRHHLSAATAAVGSLNISIESRAVHPFFLLNPNPHQSVLPHLMNSPLTPLDIVRNQVGLRFSGGARVEARGGPVEIDDEDHLGEETCDDDDEDDDDDDDDDYDEDGDSDGDGNSEEE